MVKVIGAALALTLTGGSAAAEPEAAEDRRHVVVAEAFGKLGLYSLGYEIQLHRWVSAGAAGAFWIASGRRVFASSAYLGTGGALAGPHRWFVQLGPELVHEREPAVGSFDGLSDTGLGGQLTAGYEYRRDRYLIRGHAVLTFGSGGLVPWAGVSVGARL